MSTEELITKIVLLFLFGLFSYYIAKKGLEE